MMTVEIVKRMKVKKIDEDKADVVKQEVCSRDEVKQISARYVRCLSVSPSVCLERACIVIIRCTLARIEVYGWIIQCSGHPDTKACPPTHQTVFFRFHLEEMWGTDVQIRRSIKR